MNGFLRQSTASQTRTIGPFVDDTDFKTLEDGLTIANTDIKLKKNGGASANKNSGGATADGAGGLYHLTWDATDTATVGELAYSIKVAGALVSFGSYMVLEESIYDALFAASAAFPANFGILQINDVLGVGVVVSNVSSIDTGAITAAALHADAAAEIADKILGRNIAGGSDGGRMVKDALRFLRNKWVISAGTLTVYEEDDTATAWTSAMSTAAADPITGSDPA